MTLTFVSTADNNILVCSPNTGHFKQTGNGGWRIFDMDKNILIFNFRFMEYTIADVKRENTKFFWFSVRIFVRYEGGNY